jgi:hypothetical protein
MTGQLDEVVRLNGIGFGFDFVIGIGFQYAQDYRNPYLTEGQVIGRSVVSGLGGAGFSYGAVLFVCGATAGIPCAILAGVGGGIVWSVAGQPLVFQWLGIEPAGRNLNPVNIRRRSSFDPRGKFSRI